MRVKCTYKNLDASESLTEYTEERFEKLVKFEAAFFAAHAIFSSQRHKKYVEVTVTGKLGHYKATASSAEDYYAAVDKCVSKLVTQMARHKNKIQKHKNPRKSARGRMERTNPYLEAEYIEWPKAG